MDPANVSSHPFAAALRRAEWTLQQLWLGYFGYGGTSDTFEVEAFLEGLTVLGEDQQDVLAAALNERLYELYLRDCVPYHLTLPPEPWPLDPSPERHS